MKSIIFLLLLTSCATVQKLTPPSADVNMQTEVRNGLLKTNNLYTLIMQSQDKNYATYESTYKEIEADINDIIAKDKARLHGEKPLSIALNLQEKFLKFEGEHKTKGVITNGDALSYNEALQAYWTPLLNSEMQLK